MLNLINFKIAVLAFVTAFMVTMILMFPLFKFINHFKLFDVPDGRKEHQTPIPTMGGIASSLGMMSACVFWFPFSRDVYTVSLFLSVAVLFAIGIMDDMRNIPARYKLAIQIAVSCLMAFSGIRITNFNGIFGLHEIPLAAQYTITILAITGITNAFNLIDGIDGLAGGLGFMSLVILGLFLNISKDYSDAIIAYSLCGGLLGFLYYNLNPARIFMGDTGSLILGFIIAVLCVRLLQANSGHAHALLPHTPVFAISIVAIPVFDTLRVFAIRIYSGRSPFTPDKNHIHHILTRNGWSHGFTARLMLGLHAIILFVGYYLKALPQLVGLCILLGMLLLAVLVFKNFRMPEAPEMPATADA